MRVKLRADFRNLVTDGRLHQGVTPLESYFVIEVAPENFRVIDDSGEPILYPKALFEVLDRTIPANWQFCEYPDGDYRLEPVSTGTAGFYERFFCSDGDRGAQEEARRILREVLEAALPASSEQDRQLIQRDLQRMSDA
jgi:hypothetical protein